MIVTNTPFIENQKIQKYFDVVSSHIVVGTNFFKDFSASLTDFFGGNSATYQKQLNRLYESAINELKVKAKYMGANAIIALTVDFDEIAGQGKSMFMITAIATPVILDNYHEKNNNNYITADDLKNLSLVYKYKELISEGKLQINEDTINFIVQNSIHEALPLMTSHFKNLTENEVTGPGYEKFYPMYLRYLTEIKNKSTINHLYYELRYGSNYSKDRLSKVMVDLNFYDIDRINELLSEDNILLKKIGLTLAIAKKDVYKKEDAKELYGLAEQSIKAFPDLSTTEIKKGLLGKEKQVWNCPCGKQNDIDKTFCSSCLNDKYGFSENEHNPIEIADMLFRRSKVIDESLQ